MEEDIHHVLLVGALPVAQFPGLAVGMPVSYTHLAYKIIKATKIMTPKEFKKTYWPDIAASCEETGLNPLFVRCV